MKKLTVMLDDKLYTSTKVGAARKDQLLKDFVADALIEWLDIQEDLELGALGDEAMEDYRKHGGIELDEALKEIEGERKSA